MLTRGSHLATLLLLTAPALTWPVLASPAVAHAQTLEQALRGDRDAKTSYLRRLGCAATQLQVFDHVPALKKLMEDRIDAMRAVVKGGSFRGFFWWALFGPGPGGKYLEERGIKGADNVNCFASIVGQETNDRLTQRLRQLSIPGEIPRELIGDKARALNLGNPTARTRQPTAISGGAYWQEHERGTVYYHPSFQANAVAGAIFQEWGRTGWQGGPFGYPATDELPCDGADANDRIQSFEHGLMYWRASEGRVYPLLGREAQGGDRYTVRCDLAPFKAIPALAQRLELGAAKPDSPRPAAAAGTPGLFQHFARGSVYWHPRHGAQPVVGGVLAKFTSLGAEKKLGFPTGAEAACTTPDTKDRYQLFERGRLVWQAGSGAARELPLVAKSVSDCAVPTCGDSTKPLAAPHVERVAEVFRQSMGDAYPDGPAGKRADVLLDLVWPEVRKRLAASAADRSRLNAMPPGSDAEACLLDLVTHEPRLAALVAEKVRTWKQRYPRELPLPSRVLAQDGVHCPPSLGAANAAIDRQVETHKARFRELVGDRMVMGWVLIGERARYPLSQNMKYVTDVIWELFRNDRAADLDKAGITLGSAQERCFMAKLSVANADRLAQHVDFWVRHQKDPVGTSLSSAVTAAGTWLGDVASKVGQALEKAGKVVIDALCATVAKPICDIVNVVRSLGSVFQYLQARNFNIGKAITDKFEEIKQDMERRAKAIGESVKSVFQGFGDVLTGMGETYNQRLVNDFGIRVGATMASIVRELNSFIGIPDIIGTAVGAITQGVTTAAVIPATTGLALLHFGIRKAMEFLIPEIIFGIGTVANAGADAASHMPAWASGFISTLRSVLQQFGGAVLDVFVKDGPGKERVKAALLKVADISGRIHTGLEKALGVGASLVRGNFTTIEAALQTPPAFPEKLGPADVQKLIHGLVPVVQEQVWNLLNTPLRSIIGKGLSVLNRLLDIPRNALVGAVGTIPFVGGVLASALNLGLGVLVDLIDNFLSDQIMGLAKRILDDALSRLGTALEKRLAAPGGTAAAGGLAKLLDFLARLTGELDTTLRGAAAGARGTVGALAAQGVNDLLLRGVADGEVRALVSGAVGRLGPQLAGPSVNLGEVLATALRGIGPQLSTLLTKSITAAPVRDLVSRGLTTLLQNVTTAAGVREAMRHQAGFFPGLVGRLMEQVRTPLSELLRGGAADADVTAGAETLVRALGARAQQRGLDGLVRLRDLLRDSYDELQAPLRAKLLGSVRDESLKQWLQAAWAAPTAAAGGQR